MSNSLNLQKSLKNNKDLLIVESPTKAKKISSFFRNLIVEATLGHIKDLPEKEMGIDFSNFNLKFVWIKGKRKIMEKIKRISKGRKVYIGTDPDREGEAIAYHVKKELGSYPSHIYRVDFKAITKEEVSNALKNAGDLNINRVYAQFARRAIDRIIGYTISPILWRYFKNYNLSAGRVQSAVLFEIFKREMEIRNFKPKIFWRIEANFLKDNKKFKILSKEKFEEKPEVEKEGYLTIEDIERKEEREKPPEPLKTSTLQQICANYFKISPETTMRIAQKLYEMGYITYHRTDSVRQEKSTILKIRNLIKGLFGEKFLPEKPIIYRNKSKVQDAHEAIRPAKLDTSYFPENLNFENALERKIYEIIFKWTLASQMEKAIWEKYKVKLKDNKNIEYELNLKFLKFEGWRKIFGYTKEEAYLPFRKGEMIKASFKLVKDETKPPGRYTEAKIIKWMEKTGVGRPSTYATTLKILKQRKYIDVKNRKIYLTRTGENVARFLERNYKWLCDKNFTAQMEEELDKIEIGEKKWKELLKEFLLQRKLDKI